MFGTMFIVLSNLTEGKTMFVSETMTHDENKHDSSVGESDTPQSPSQAQMAAVVEAAYILEAVRK